MSVTPISAAPSQRPATEHPVCVVCGVEVPSPGYAELKDPWRSMMDKLCRCEEHDDSDEAEAEELRQMKRGHYREALAFALIPPKLRGLGWSDLDREEPEEVQTIDSKGNAVTVSAAEASRLRSAAIDAAVRWSQGKIGGLVLAGRVGIGKSRIAAVAAQSLIYHRVDAQRLGDQAIAPIRWVSVPRLIRDSRGDYGTDARRDAEKIMHGMGGLVLDDIDKVKPTELALDLIFESLEIRIGNGSPLLVTTNKRFPELQDQLGDPIASRIAGNCEGYRIVGEDRRGS